MKAAPTSLYLHQQLSHIGQGVMYNYDEAAEKLPNDIVQYIRMDQTGKLLMAGHQPRYWTSDFEHSFPLQLCFYRKGVDFFIKATGTAIVTNKEKIKAAFAAGKRVFPLFKMTPEYIEFISRGATQKLSPLKTFYSFLNRALSKMPHNNGHLY